MNRARPFYPCQIETGATYVVDGRTGKIVETIREGFDVVRRWQVAKRRAEIRNDRYREQFVRRRRALVVLILMATLGGMILGLLR